MRFKNIKKKIWKCIIISFLVCIILWLIGGSLYKVIFHQKIENKIYLLKRELQTISALEEYKQNEIQVVNTRAIISKTLVMFFQTNELPSTTFSSVQHRLEDDGWAILKTSERVYEFTAQKEPYILTVSMDRSKPEYTWAVFIEYDDFFSKYNL
ncbi:hypothetical protein OCV58_09380 [Megasphaera butyrica]|uniref:hypothetical protein n=1 Tax=Megasphaera TaxID=906 RepID=UPI0008203D59|nr:hypothetical protein [Megasphaera butyrica]MCU6715114.1 hypothetical protein [Megasphaera butyrica]SCH93477.1 Uncharacterised protein [uncultured Megasphaera sp.]SCJ49415.1 Uncharacterised protein [uncultured Ruminococcus sp.]